MGRSPVTLSRLRLGRLKVVRRRLLQRYEHQPLVSCLAGLYGCQWRRYQRSRLECASLGILIVTFALTLVLLYLWSEVLAVCLLSEGQRLYLHWGHKVDPHFLSHSPSALSLSARFLIFIVSVYEGLDVQVPGTCPLVLAVFLTQVYCTLADLSAELDVSVTVWRAAVLGLFLALLLALYLVPLGMYSPCIKDEGTLGPAPALIGHRGAPMLAPENTEMSFEKAVEAGAQGLETDVTLSYDGVPFLMHDRTLQRTTNVQEVFPNRTKEPAAMFSWSELEQLNAGAWFLSVSARSRNQSVYTLRGFLDLAARHDRLVIFDLYRPPIGHPYRDTWITRTLEVVQNESSIRSSQVMWLAPEMRYLVQELDPELQQTSGQMAPIEELQEEGIVKLNLHYSTMSQKLIRYCTLNISTNLYVVSQPWLYSLAWCAGVQSITTNAPQILINLSFPLFIMTPEQYRLMWVLTDIVSAVLSSLVMC
uniref:Glycerophosphodiester phosphodiesterase domain containing 4 n=1 Tax=Scleropages formosus TaxID=113540 RepID=A0A8C9VTW6_SCLFO